MAFAPALPGVLLVGADVVLVLGRLVETLARRAAALPTELSGVPTPPPGWCCNPIPPASPFDSFMLFLGQLHPGPGWHHQELTRVTMVEPTSSFQMEFTPSILPVTSKMLTQPSEARKPLKVISGENLIYLLRQELLKLLVVRKQPTFSDFHSAHATGHNTGYSRQLTE